MVEGCGKASDISDDTTTDNENWFVSCNTVVFHIDQNFLNTFDIFVDLVTSMDQLNQRNFVGIKVVLQDLTKETFYLIVDNSNASSKRQVDLSQNFILWIENISGDLNCGRDVGAHDSLDSL